MDFIQPLVISPSRVVQVLLSHSLCRKVEDALQAIVLSKIISEEALLVLGHGLLASKARTKGLVQVFIRAFGVGVDSKVACFGRWQVKLHCRKVALLVEKFWVLLELEIRNQRHLGSREVLAKFRGTRCVQLLFAHQDLRMCGRESFLRVFSQLIRCLVGL